VLIILSVLMLALFLASTTAFGQPVRYNWKDYGVSFAIPKTHKIITNTADEFESGDTQTRLEMYPFKDAEDMSYSFKPMQ